MVKSLPSKDGFLFITSNDSQMFYYNFDEVQTFAGGDERSSRDETVLYLRFYTTAEIAVEFGNVVTPLCHVVTCCKNVVSQ